MVYMGARLQGSLRGRPVGVRERLLEESRRRTLGRPLCMFHVSTLILSALGGGGGARRGGICGGGGAVFSRGCGKGASTKTFGTDLAAVCVGVGGAGGLTAESRRWREGVEGRGCMIPWRRVKRKDSEKRGDGRSSTTTAQADMSLRPTSVKDATHPSGSRHRWTWQRAASCSSLLPHPVREFVCCRRCSRARPRVMRANVSVQSKSLFAGSSTVPSSII